MEIIPVGEILHFIHFNAHLIGICFSVIISDHTTMVAHNIQSIQKIYVVSQTYI